MDEKVCGQLKNDYLCIIFDTLTGVSMKKATFDRYGIYDLDDETIMGELCQKIKSLRISCCYSQQEFAEQCNVSVITIKRIESGVAKDITMGTLMKIMRTSGTLEGIVDLIPDVPESPYLINEKTGKRIQRFNSKRKMT